VVDFIISRMILSLQPDCRNGFPVAGLLASLARNQQILEGIKNRSPS
jgi:hypothetical protein